MLSFLRALMPNFELVSTTRFLSLKWKAVLVFSLVLIIINASLAGLAYMGLQRQFAQQREQVYLAHKKQIQGLMENSYQRMEKLADIAPLLYGGNDGGVSLLSRIRSIFNQQGNLLQMVWGVEIASLYSADNQPLMPTASQMGTDQASAWVRVANEMEQPVTGLECEDRCIQYVAVPLLADNERAGVLLLGRSLADVVVAFHKVSGDDMGVITANDSRARDTRQWLSEWDVRVAALTNARRNLSILQSVAENYSLESVAAHYAWYRQGDKKYEIRLIPINDTGGKSSSQLVVISDITKALANIQIATRRSLLGGLIGLLVSEFFLLLLLGIPMARLQRVVLSLPHLAEHAFETARASLGRSVRYCWWRDEIDVLNNTAMTLS